MALSPKKLAEYAESIRQHKLAAQTVRSVVFPGRQNHTFGICPDDALLPDEPSAKKIILMRHGEGYHNVAQREWRANPDWDGKSEPYTVNNDPEYLFEDPHLTPKGQAEAQRNQERCSAAPTPELLLVSPMRRAIETGLTAFASSLADGSLTTVLANELAHERAGAHTCDKRANKTVLMSEFPTVDFGDVVEEDPSWKGGDINDHESFPALAERACHLLSWLERRPERYIALAAHSGLLLALVNGAMEADNEESSKWFVTGEMRTIIVKFSGHAAL